MTTVRNNGRRRWLFFIAFLIIAFAGAVALWLRPRRAKPVTVPRGARAGDVSLEPCLVKIGGTEYAADCGTLVVPEYRGDPPSRLIALPLQRIHSPAPNPAKPIFYLSGGPGMSNMDWTPTTWLLANRDVVKVGYRGVDGTPKLDCPDFSAAAHGYGENLLSHESLDLIGKAAAVCADKLQATGVDLRGYAISEVVEDMEAARAALGYERINLLSESYGTRVAQVYAYMHPRNLLRSAMIGVNPPGHFLFLPKTIDGQLEYYAGLCRKDAACSARTSDLAASMRKVNRSMPSSWMGVPINSGKARMVAFAMLFHRSTAPIVFDAYLTAANGDASGLAAMSVAYDFIMPNMMAWGEFMAIGCSADYKPGHDYRGELIAHDSILGSPMAELIWLSASGHWPPLLMPEEYRKAHMTDVETLLISGSVDFSTPAQFARQELLPFLRNGRHVVIAEQGHVKDFWDFQPEAARRLLTSFFDTGKADDSLYRYLPMDFKPSMSFPLLAKILLGAGLLVILAMAFAVFWIVRLVRRRLTAAKG
jgi:pimeloyl-ACP methyl ester carboxylesterase